MTQHGAATQFVPDRRARIADRSFEGDDPPGAPPRGVSRLARPGAARRVASVLLKSGKVEEVATSSGSGHGVHAMTGDGRTALGSRDEFLAEPALALLDHTVAAAGAAGLLGVAPGIPATLEPVVARSIPEGLDAFDRIDLADAAARLGELERELAGRVPGVKLSLSYQADLDAWRIVRSDGGDVMFAMPRCVIRFAASSSGDARHTVAASVAARARWRSASWWPSGAPSRDPSARLRRSPGPRAGVGVVRTIVPGGRGHRSSPWCAPRSTRPWGAARARAARACPRPWARGSR